VFLFGPHLVVPRAEDKDYAGRQPACVVNQNSACSSAQMLIFLVKKLSPL